jgi:O-antigen/teichoic acid export membrane protein
MSAAYCAIIIVLAHFAEAAFDAPKLEELMQWMTIPLMLSAFGNTHMALRLREFGHSTLAVRSFVAGVLGAIVAVVAVVLGAGIWAFVFQRIVREAVATLLAWNSYPWRPRFRFNVGDAKADLRIGRELTGAQLVSYLTLRAQDLLIGKFMGPVPLSTYRVAWRSTELIGPGLVSTFSNVALQTFSRLQENRSELRTAYTTLLRQCALLSIPALVGYGVAGPWLVPAVFGPQWRESGWIAPALMPLAIPFTLNFFVLSLLSALGHVTWQRQLALLDLISTVVVAAVAVWFGLIWVALAYSLRAYLWVPVELYLVKKASGIGVRDHLRALWVPTIGSVVMAALVGPTLYALNTYSFVVIGLVCALGAIVYAAVVLLFLLQERQWLLALISHKNERASDASRR